MLSWGCKPSYVAYEVVQEKLQSLILRPFPTFSKEMKLLWIMIK